MSDYEDEEFENYDDEGFEEEAEDEYDVLPSNMAKSSTPKQASPAPKEQLSPKKGGPVRTSYTGAARPPSAGMQGTVHRPAGTVAMPAFAGLTDAERRTAMKKLAGALQRLKKVKLSVVVMDDFPQLQSLSKFELYNMGRSVYSKYKVASAQTHEDDKEEEAQTEEIGRGAYACQVPEDRNVVFEGEHTLAAGSSAKSAAAASNAAHLAAHPSAKAILRITQMPVDQESKLLAFMRWAGPVMLAAMGMNPTVKKLAINAWGSVDASTPGLSQGSARLTHEGLLAQRPVTGVSFCPGGAPLLLASYAAVGAQLGAAALLNDHTLNSKGILCAWDLSAPANPSAVMVSEASPSCCCWAPAPSTTLVFAGMEEGGVCAWDLEEPESRHPVEQVAGGQVFTRRPSYTTEYLADVATTAAPIVGIATTPKTESRARPCQVVSLNGWGAVTVYTAVLMAPSERNAADQDIGLRPGSRLKLVRTTQLTRLGLRAMRPPPRKADALSLDQLVQTFSLQVLPGTEGQLLVGSDAGRVLRGSLMGAAAAPKEYVPDGHNSQLAVHPSAASMPSCVTSLHASPFLPGAFLSGHSNGSVTLHALGMSAAVAVWHDVSKQKILVVRWSPVRPAVFYALDALCTVYTFDLTASRTAPVAAQSLMIQDKSKAVASLPTFFEVALVQTGEGGAGGKGVPVYCVGYDDGLLDVNLLSVKQVSVGKDELKVLQELLAVADKPKAPAASPRKAAASPKKAAAKPKPKPKPAPPPEEDY